MVGVPEQVMLCQFVNYFMRNSLLFLEGDHPLYSLMSRQLYHLTQAFSWSRYHFLTAMREDYILPVGEVDVNEQLYQKILFLLEKEILWVLDSIDGENVKE